MRFRSVQLITGTCVQGQGAGKGKGRALVGSSRAQGTYCSNANKTRLLPALHVSQVASSAAAWWQQAGKCGHSNGTVVSVLSLGCRQPRLTSGKWPAIFLLIAYCSQGFMHGSDRQRV